MGLLFFGLREEDKATYLLEQIFILMYYCNFSYSEAMSISVPERVWFIKRTIEEINKQYGGESKDAEPKPLIPPEVRALMNMATPQKQKTKI